MKSRWSIAIALLFALLLAPSAMRASVRPMGSTSCQVAKGQFHVNSIGRQAGGNLAQILASKPGQHTPAPRLHRNRGKKINIEGTAIPSLQCVAATRRQTSCMSFVQENSDGPNPSRGPPSQFSV
jgi:hypothetical protein